jgi:hypothetical protein
MLDVSRTCADARRLVVPLIVASFGLALTVFFAPRIVAACGGFFSARSMERRPSLAYEQALIVYDPKTATEHFIREVAFRGGASSFGFVVPTPARPEVAKVDKSPFPVLRDAFHFEKLLLQGLRGGGGAMHAGAGAGASRGVTVLEVTQVGSFKTFVLSATDASGLAGWLRANGFVSTKEADAWLAHYVQMKFYFVAMRYDPPKADAGVAAGLQAETIRISFSTPLPYYPYFEPKPPPVGTTAGGHAPRLLELWLVSPEALTPVAARTRGGTTTWTSPFQSGELYGTGGDTVRPRLDLVLKESGIDELLPPGGLVVQTFQDQKTLREGYGDALFVPMRKTPLDPARAEALAPLLGALDPALVPEGKP